MSDLQDAISDAMGAIFDAIPDCVRECAYMSTGTASAYDPVVGSVSTAMHPLGYINMIFSHFRFNEIDGSHVLISDIKAIAKKADLDNYSIVPKKDDMLMTDGGNYTIYGFWPDAMNVTMTFQLRKA